MGMTEPLPFPGVTCSRCVVDFRMDAERVLRRHRIAQRIAADPRIVA